MEQLKQPALPKRVLPTSAKKAAVCLGAAAAGFVLSGGRILGIHLPLAVCLTAALGACLPGLACYLGSCVGGILLWGADLTLVTLTCGFLSLVLSWALAELPLAEKPWFPAFSALFPGLIVCTLCFLAEGLSLRGSITFLLQLTVLVLGTWCAQNVLEKPTGPGLCAALFALCCGSGACRIYGIPLGGILAGGAVFSLTGTVFAVPAAILTGLGLDWSRAAEVSCTAILSASALAAAGLHRQKRVFSLLGFCLTAGAVAVTHKGGGGLFLAMTVGAAGAYFLPKLQVEEPARFPEEAVRARLQAAGRAMNAIYCRLDDVPAMNQHLEIADIYDKATSRVCTTCAHFQRCWKQEGAQTHRILLQAAPGIFTRRIALEEDFPDSFRSQCRHFPKLLAAITDALEQDTVRRQRENFRRELRAVVAGQYRVLSDYLRGGVMPRRVSALPQFSAETGCSTCSLQAGPCGDVCAGFRAGQRQYLLLCDGMGTGEAAAEDSRTVSQLLSALLLSGMEPDDALETLGAMAILRDSGGTATVDLAWVSLVTGEGALFKWGGGDSWLLTEKTAKKIGTASLPPGLGVGGTQVAQQVKLSLKRGEVLVLTSDGVDGEDVRRQAAAVGDWRAEDLAAAIAEGTGSGEDDRSAAVLRLRPTSNR